METFLYVFGYSVRFTCIFLLFLLTYVNFIYLMICKRMYMGACLDSLKEISAE